MDYRYLFCSFQSNRVTLRTYVIEYASKNIGKPARLWGGNTDDVAA